MLRSFLPVLHIISIVIICLAATMCIPLLASVLLAENLEQPYLHGMLFSFLTAGTMFLLTRKYKRSLLANHAVLLICGIWILLPIFAAVPFALALYKQNIFPSLIQTYFEIVSCFTTTGASTFTEFNKLPVSINLWRTFLQWLGGMGIVLLAVAVLPLIGASGKQLYKLDAAGGPIQDNNILTPRISQMAKGLWLIYLSMSFLCALLYWISGLNPLEAIMLMFTTISLGGSSLHDASVGHYNSIFTEIIAIIFMLIASCNFALYFNAIRSGKFNILKNNVEVRATLTTIISCAIFISAFLYFKGSYSSIYDALRYGSFNSISLISTTGFVNSDYSTWPVFAPTFLLIMSGIAASAGSTGGGIKMMRIILILKQAQSEFVKLIHPSSVRPVVLANKIIPKKVIFSISVFIFFYVLCILVLSLILMMTDLDGLTAFSAILLSINCVGTGLGMVGPEFSFSLLSDFQLSICALAMLLGRLEIISLLVLFTPTFWRN